MKTNFTKEITLDGGVSAQLVGTVLKIKGPKGEVSRDFKHPIVSVAVEGSKVIIKTKRATKSQKMLFGSNVSHIKNMIQGVKEPHIYKLKICSGHFPMNVAVVGSEFIVKNFFGETVPRKIHLFKGVEVKVSGTDIVISSPDLELAGQTASRIENLCRITNRDIRIFQDGCYIYQKPE